MKNMKVDQVILITVTFNSSHFLERLVKAAAKQTYPLKKIICVDNASNEEHVKAIDQLKKEYPLLDVVRSEENLGGGGGFQKGAEYVLKNELECDWIWIMDDDAFPRENCLEKLLEHKNITGMGSLVPFIYGVELQEYQYIHHKKLSKYLDTDISIGTKLEDFDDITEVETNAFVGPLVKVSVVKDVGVPNGGLFIYGDDTEYMYRISRKYKVCLIKGAVINHRDVIADAKTKNDRGFWKTYYRFRNRLLFIDEFQKDAESGRIGKKIVKKQIMRECVKALLKKEYARNRWLRVECLLRALKDGMNGKYGKVIDPAEFAKRIR